MSTEPKPWWVEKDDLDFLFRHELELLETGRVVWGAMIQANGDLFTPRYFMGAPGEVLYDPAGRMTPEALADLARALFRCKGSQGWPRAEDQYFADYLANERIRVFGLDAPSNCGCYPLKVSTTYFDQLHLPDGMLSLSHFPILISDSCPGAVKLLPCQFWPEDFKEQWAKAGETRHGQRYDAKQLRQQAEAAAAAMQAEYDQDPSPFNVIPASLYEEGLLYFHGLGVEKDYGKARRFWEKAVRMGNHPESMNNLGILYAQGLGVEADLETAYDWYFKAAEQDYVLGQLNLGKMHLLPDPKWQDPDLAKQFLTMAMGQGNREAKELLKAYNLLDEPGSLGRLWKKWLQ